MKNILIVIVLLVASGANISYNHGELHFQYMGLTDLLEVFKDGLGTGIATIVGWMLMRSPLRQDEKKKPLCNDCIHRNHCPKLQNGQLPTDYCPDYVSENQLIVFKTGLEKICKWLANFK